MAVILRERFEKPITNVKKDFDDLIIEIKKPSPMNWANYMIIAAMAISIKSW